MIILHEQITDKAKLKICHALGFCTILEYKHKIKKILKIIRYPTYEVRTEIVDDSEQGGNGNLEMRVAYNPNNEYIGEPKIAKMLADKGIMPELIKGNHVCSIGYSPKDKKWYGWSHRAIAGFKPGYKVRKGNSGLDQWEPGHFCKDTEEAKEMAIAFANSVS